MPACVSLTTCHTPKLSADEQGGSKGHRDPGEPILVCLAEIEPEPIRWLWYPRMPEGALVMLDGDPAAGKSYFSLAIAAAVSLGAPLPDGGGDADLDGPTKPVGDLNRGAAEAGNVLLILAEDDNPTVVRPRLDKLGADVRRIQALKGIYRREGEDFLLLDQDGFPVVRRALETVRPRLGIIDPVLAYVDGRLDAHRQNAVRSVTRPLAEMAREYDVVMLALRHLTKADGGKAIYRGQTSIDWVAAARSALMVGFHPEDRKLPEGQRRRVLAQFKSNEAYGASLAFKIDHLGLTWVPGTVEVAADDLVAPREQEKPPSKLDLAMDWLLENHKTKARRADDVIRDAVAAGHTERTLRRAFTGLQGKSKVEYVKGEKGVDHWVWLPLSGASSEQGQAGSDLDGQTEMLGHLNTDGHDSMGLTDGSLNGNGHDAADRAVLAATVRDRCACGQRYVILGSGVRRCNACDRESQGARGSDD